MTRMTHLASEQHVTKQQQRERINWPEKGRGWRRQDGAAIAGTHDATRNSLKRLSCCQLRADWKLRATDYGRDRLDTAGGELARKGIRVSHHQRIPVTPIPLQT